MENPWGSMSRDSSCENISCDLAKLRISAADALRDIETTYREIMGCDSSNENVGFETPDFLFQENDFHNIYSTEYMNNESCVNYRLTSNPLEQRICFNCKSFFVPSFQEFYSRNHSQYNKLVTEPIEYEENSQGDTNYIFNNIATKDDDDHILKHPIKVNNLIEPERINIIHERPLKITIPEPFQMTLRDEMEKPIKDMKLELLRKQINNDREKELVTSIHSNPVPCHTYMPLYKKMAETNEARKQMRKSNAAKIKNDATKSFKLTINKKINRADSVPDLSTMKKSHIPIANPIPKFIFDPAFTERMRNKEEMRKIRIKKRAEETLRKAALPFTNRNSLHKCDSVTNLGKVEKSQIHNIYKTANVCSNGREIMKTWNSKVLETLPMEKVNMDSKDRYNNFLHSQKSPLYDVPIRMTTASMLREKTISEHQGVRTEETFIHRGDQKIRSKLLSQLKMRDQNLSSQEDFQKKLQNFRELRKARQEEYERELLEMGLRVEGQPLLIQRQMKSNKNESVPVSRESSAHTFSKASSNTNSLCSNTDGEEDISLHTSDAHDLENEQNSS